MELNNYEYIIASLPVLQPEFRGPLDAGGILEEIRTQLSGKDAADLDFLLDGWDADKLDEAFYREASRRKNGFIRDYFAYDLRLRNAKVAWLNKALGRPDGQDMIPCGEEDFEDLPIANEVLSQQDILGRERGLDDLLWRRIDSLTIMHVFDMDVILGFAAKLKIVDRWLALDEDAGRELFHRLVAEIRENYGSQLSNT